MARLLLRRILLSIPLLFLVTFAIFALVALIPGDPAVIFAGPGADPHVVEFVRRSLHLNDPLLVRYWQWARDAATGNLGNSYEIPHPSVAGEITSRAPITASLAGLSIVITVLVSTVLGTLSAVTVGRWPDRILKSFFAFSIAMPGFWLGYLLVAWFAIDLHWFPAIEYAPLSSGLWPWLSHLLLPALVLGQSMGPALSLQLRGALIEVLGKEYILSARAKGLRTRSVVFKHALKNAVVPVVTLLGFQIANLLGAAVIVENVFSIQGLGTLAIGATFARDVPVMLGLVLVTTLLVLVVNLLVDVSYGYFNPKVRRA